MSMRRMVFAALLVAILAGCTTAQPHQAEPAGPSGSGATPEAASSAPVEPAATPVSPDPAVGAVFLGAGSLHTCTATVLASKASDLILTAAHCMADGIDTTFVPGFNNDAAPDDTWHVDAVYLDQRWLDTRDPLADFAIARVSRDAGGAPAAGGLTLGSAPAPGTAVTVTGYPLREGGGPIGCQATTSVVAGGFPSLPCAGLVAGVSGAPWVNGTTVTGVVGGLDGGGCDENLSYSSPFDSAVQALLQRAEAGGPGDAAPTAFDDGC